MAVRRSRLLLEQVLEDQGPPALVLPRLHKRAPFFELSEIDGRETEFLGKRRYRRCSPFVVARQEHDPPAALDVRVGGQGAGGEMIEAFHEPGAGDRSRDVGNGLLVTAQDRAVALVQVE